MTDASEHGPVITVPGRTRHAYRLSIMIAFGIGVLGLVVGAVYGGVTLVGFVCVGLALGALNGLLVQRAVLRQSAADIPSKAKLVRGVGARLAVVTAIAVILAFVFNPQGLGTFLGLALFQVINTIVGSVPALKELRQ